MGDSKDLKILLYINGAFMVVFRYQEQTDTYASRNSENSVCERLPVIRYFFFKVTNMIFISKNLRLLKNKFYRNEPV
jgi:hypothetical protein